MLEYLIIEITIIDFNYFTLIENKTILNNQV